MNMYIVECPVHVSLLLGGMHTLRRCLFERCEMEKIKKLTHTLNVIMKLYLAIVLIMLLY